MKAYARAQAKRLVHGPLAPLIRAALKSLLLNQYIVYGDGSRLRVAESAVLGNTVFNTVSGDIDVGPHAFFGHNVCVLTGTHDYRNLGHARQQAELTAKNDIRIGEGAWLASNVTVIGPSVVGCHAVVAAGAVVRGDVPDFAIVAGVPARRVGTVEPY